MTKSPFSKNFPPKWQKSAESECVSTNSEIFCLVLWANCGISLPLSGDEDRPFARSRTAGHRAEMSGSDSNLITRRGVLGMFAATAVAAAPTYSNAAGFLRGSGDFREIQLYSSRTGESVKTVYWIDGKYIKEAMYEISKFMRDWRTGDVINIDNRAIDIMAAAHRILDTSEPYLMLSGYRSPQTNAMLRSRSRSVARNSLHVKGQAADLRLKSRSVSQLAKAASSCASGGVGRYHGSNFVHVDCGPIRTWRG